MQVVVTGGLTWNGLGDLLCVVQHPSTGYKDCLEAAECSGSREQVQALIQLNCLPFPCYRTRDGSGVYHIWHLLLENCIVGSVLSDGKWNETGS